MSICYIRTFSGPKKIDYTVYLYEQYIIRVHDKLWASKVPFSRIGEIKKEDIETYNQIIKYIFENI